MYRVYVEIKKNGSKVYWSPNFLAVVFKSKKFYSKESHNAGFSI